MRVLVAASLAVLTLASCTDLTLPPPPAPPGPGSVQGTLVYAVPGRTTAEPAVGATVRLANSTLEAVAGEDGYFRLENLVTQGGTLLIQFDVDRDGAPDRQRRLDLAGYGAGFGKDVSLGTVLLGRNSTVAGIARRGDAADQPTGHAGTSVFVPEGPFATQTADDGSFLLEAMPEGPLTLAFFRPGYESTVQSTTLRAGERLQLETVLLTVKPVADLPGTLGGTVLQADGAPAEGATVSLPGLGVVATTDADGRFSASVPAGLYAVTVAKAGFVSVVVPNVLVASGATAQIGLVLVPVASGAGGGGGSGGGAGGGGGGAGGGGAGGGGAGGGGAGGGDAGAGGAGGGDAGAGGGGGDDAGAGGGGGGGDGGTDAGGLPVAIIEPHAAAYLPSELVILSGATSTGVQPLTYQWEQLRPDAGFIFTDYLTGTNGTRSGFEIRGNAPWWDANHYELRLVVTDALGRVSAPATTAFVVSAVPIAELGAVPAAVGSGAVFTVSGATSRDDNTYPVPLVQHAWSAAAGTPTLTPNAMLNGREVQVRAPIVSAPTILRLRLRVTNALGISGEVESSDIVVRPLDDAGTWQLAASAAWAGDAGAVLTVPSLAPVTLRAQVETTLPDAGFVYAWSPQSDPDGGWALTGANAALAAFVAPKVVGATRTLQFTATVSTTAMDLIPAQRTAQVTVAVVDEDPPAVVATTFPSGTGSIFGATVNFDEELSFDPYTLADVLDNLGTVVGKGRLVGARSLFFKPTRPWVVGQTYRIRLRALRDRSPAQNLFPPNYDVTYLTFVGSLGVSAPFESTDQSANDPLPGLLLRRAPPPTDGGMGQQPALQLFGRRSLTAPGPESAWFLQSRSAWAFGCPPVPVGSPCALPTFSGGPTPPLLADAGVPIKRSFVLGAQPVGVLEVGATSDAGVALLLTTDLAGSPSLVTAGGAPLGPVGYGPDAGLVSAGVSADGTLGFAAVDRLTNTWVEASIGSLTNWRPDGQLAVVADANHRVVVGQTASSGWSRVAWGTSAGWLVSEASSTPSSSPRALLVSSEAGPPGNAEAWAFMLTEYEVASVVTTRLIGRHFTRDATTLWVSGNYDVLETTWVTGFDVLKDADLAYVAYVTGGQLRVRAWPWSDYSFTTTGSTLLPGAHPDGVMNEDPACEAAHPELLADEDFLYLAWQERCAGQNWKMAYRVLH